MPYNIKRLLPRNYYFFLRAGLVGIDGSPLNSYANNITEEEEERKRRGREEEERERRGKRIQEEMKRSRWGGARGRKLVWGVPFFFYYYCGGGISLGGRAGRGGPTLIRRPH